MKKWVLKALIQKIISFLPGSDKINFWFQKNITKGVRLDDAYFSDKLKHAEDHIRFFREAHPKSSFKSLELGTGWYPVVPIALYLSGAERTVTIDLSPLLNADAFRLTINKFRTWITSGRLKNWEVYFDPERVSFLQSRDVDLMSLEELSSEFNLEYRVGDARKLKDENQSFDLIHSNNVFEHIYPKILKDILLEFKRVLKPNGIMSHFIDMSDHFAHLDPNISIYNFLRFREGTWRLIDNSVQPQNRMRLEDYKHLYQELGLEIGQCEMRPGKPEIVKQLDLAPPYKGRDPKELAISHAHLVNTLSDA